MNPEAQRPTLGPKTPADIKDSVFVNLAESVDNVLRKLSAPVRRGARASMRGRADLDTELRNDMVSVLNSPLAQLWKAQPVPRMSSAQAEALRKLYASVKVESNPDKGLEAILKTAVKLLMPSYETEAADESADREGDDDQKFGPSMPSRRSARLAMLPAVSYKEGHDKDEEEHLMELLNEEMIDGDDEEEYPMGLWNEEIIDGGDEEGENGEEEENGVEEENGEEEEDKPDKDTPEGPGGDGRRPNWSN